MIEHLADPDRPCVEAARVLAPGGRLVVNVPPTGGCGARPTSASGHARRYTRRTLRARPRGRRLRARVAHPRLQLAGAVRCGPNGGCSGGAKPALGLDRRSSRIDRAAMVLTAVERLLVGRVVLPVGTSILAVARVAGPATAGGA